MKYVNVVYEYEYESADIILVPDEVADNIEDVVQRFFCWLHDTPDHPYFVTDENGFKMTVSNSTIFVEWLNMMYNKDGNQESKVVKIGTDYVPEYPMADF